MARWIVELEPGVFLADGDGDPPRTLDSTTAREFQTHPSACRGLSGARAYRPFQGARVTLGPNSEDDSDAEDE